MEFTTEESEAALSSSSSSASDSGIIVFEDGDTIVADSPARPSVGISFVFGVSMGLLLATLLG